MNQEIYVGLFDQYREAYFNRNFSASINKAKFIKRIVCQYFSMEEELVESLTRKREVVIARQIGIYFIKKRTTLTLKAIGGLYNRDHSTVLYADQTVNDVFDTDRKFKKTVLDIEKRLDMINTVQPLELCEA